MHWSNSFNYLYELIDTQIKEIFLKMHKMVLFEIKNNIFHTTNKIFNK